MSLGLKNLKDDCFIRSEQESIGNVEDKDFLAHLPCVVVLVVELSEGLVAYAIGVVEAAKRKSLFIF